MRSVGIQARGQMVVFHKMRHAHGNGEHLGRMQIGSTGENHENRMYAAQHANQPRPGMNMSTLRYHFWKFATITTAVGLCALLLLQTLRLADAEQEKAQAIATLAKERSTHERAAREQSERFRQLEGTHREHIAKIDTDAQAALVVADAGRVRAVDARNRLQRDLADYLTQHRAAAIARAAAGQCAPDTSAADLLAELQRRADDRAGELAHIADTARARGQACERAYDSARAMIEAANAQAQ